MNIYLYIYVFQCIVELNFEMVARLLYINILYDCI